MSGSTATSSESSPSLPADSSERTTVTTRLILDCDTGTDDAIAILAAATHPELELVAVTTVNGNVPLANVTENTLRVLDHIGSNVPVYAGANRPIVRDDFPIPRNVLNGDSSMHPPYLDLPESVSKAQSASAVEFLIDYYSQPENHDTVLVAVGPLTNVGLALAAAPELAQLIPRLVIMGGARGWGNVTAAAEFNIWVDPEAAEAVLSAGIRDVTIVPLDATHSAPLTAEHCERFRAIGTPAAIATESLLRGRIEAYSAQGETGAPVHDALCIAYLVHPEVLSDVHEWPVHVETRGERTLGQTVMDARDWANEPPNARVALRANVQVFADFLADAFGA